MKLTCLLVPCSELAGPFQDVTRAGDRGTRDSAATPEVLLLRPERGRPRPRATQSALCTGQSIYFIFILLFMPFIKLTILTVRLTRSIFGEVWFAMHIVLSLARVGLIAILCR